LLDYEPIKAGSRDNFSQSALSTAADRGHFAVVQQLLDRWANMCLRKEVYTDVLLAASWIGDRKVVQLLLERGAKIKIQEIDEDQAESYAWALRKASREYRSDRSDRQVVEMLLEKGADLDSQSACYGKLRQAVISSRSEEEIVQLLLEEGRRSRCD
jgi:ankyrin repeat protein